MEKRRIITWGDKISKAKMGHTTSEEARKKMSIARKGRQTWMKGKHHTEEAKEKNRQKHLGLMAKDKHWNWQGGKSEESDRIRATDEYKLWRKAVYKRDKYTCVLCGNNESGNLHADHIKQFAFYPELRFNIDNGRTLCVPCHKATETWGNSKR